jgi:hypothetical protein
MALSNRNILIVVFLVLFFFSLETHAFGAGSESTSDPTKGSVTTDQPPDIASISAVEGKNWRHGDIEDVLKTVACIHRHKWNSMMIKRVYFGYA